MANMKSERNDPWSKRVDGELAATLEGDYIAFLDKFEHHLLFGIMENAGLIELHRPEVQ